jgi:hypothetical protein
MGLEADHDELMRLGRNAAKQRPAHETRKYAPVDKTIPREARVGFAIGGGLLLVCFIALVARAIVNRAPSQDGGGTAIPALKAAPAPAPAPAQNPDEPK